MAYTDWYAIRISPTLLARFIVAVEVAAVTIWTEPATVANHAARISWAQRALFVSDKAQSYANLMLRIAAATDSVFQATGEGATDTYIQGLVSTCADALALSNF
jgi:hypothetical protein